MADLHTHILPGLDNGTADLDSAVQGIIRCKLTSLSCCD